mmetsp:Transcript_2481/g.7439  ORF Transcript_2481/g.7439 Transcript_2481/m.7439 type:complete len:227 (-) Transcript_2481:548-1228(-)
MRIILLGEQARKLETEVDVRLAAFGKLCAGFDTTYGNRSGETGLATDQLAIGKAAEISDLLRRLEDVNGRLSSCISGVSDPRAQMLTRHRGVLQDYSQEYRRLSANLGDARDRTELFGSGTTEVMGLAGQEQAAHDRYERSSIARSNLAIGEVLGQAEAVSSQLTSQRQIFLGMGGKMQQLANRFPALNGIMTAIRRKKSKDTIILSAVIAVCTIFTVLYWWSKGR